ncbi:hypothetical protein DIURU_003749 [Diutina rugosa]|uniref:Cullin family profile domain-containing protein n=1 Tax=Diutina rugosa TaxID=5481 RepID=A0A642UKA1_DIURU|nr:uncharacterized protein DIURU_003749 [Diutina rugosa]KAA8900547.1 hypothetical protein DIURU_003749 [Diutina rugosa]
MNRSKIRPPRRSRLTEGSAADFDASWQVLAEAFASIQRKRISHLSYEQLHRRAYLMVIQKQGAKLYDNVSQLIQAHLSSRRDEIIAMTAADDTFVQAVLQEWDEHLQAMRYISDILMYLNRNYVKDHKRLMVYDLGISLFGTHFVAAGNHEVGQRVIGVILDEITKSRQGQVITSTALISRTVALMEMLVDHNNGDIVFGEDNFYTAQFEPQFLARSETFLYELAAQWASTGDGTVYVEQISSFIRDEQLRVASYLPQRTADKLAELINNILINDRIDAQLSLPGGLGSHLDTVVAAVTGSSIVNYSYFEMLYQLFGRVSEDYKLLCSRIRDGVATMAPKLVDMCRQQANSDGKKMSASQFAIKWVHMVLDLSNQLYTLWERSFDRNLAIEGAFTEAIKDVVNRAPKKAVTSSAPETLSVYMDHHIKQLQKQSADVGDASCQSVVDNSLKFLRYIRDRDAFEVHYANHFAKRFLNAKQAGANTIEEMILARLAEEMGVNSLEQVMKMNNDIKASRDINQVWRQQKSPVDLEVKICNAQDWPSAMTKNYQESSVIWPQAVRQTLRQFEEFWRGGQRNENKSLHWTAKFGSVDMRITYPSRTYEITLATYAAIIMLLFAPQSVDDNGHPVSAFEENREFTVAEIQELTGIPDSDLRRHLQSIAVAPRSRLLVKTPMSKEVNDGDKFRLNHAFKSPSVKVKVLTVSSSSAPSKSEQQDIDHAVVEGRKLEVNAAIVRVLKSRRQVDHNELLQELVKMLSSRFRPSVLVMKQQIDDLIDREYLKRDEDNRNLYHYVA